MKENTVGKSADRKEMGDCPGLRGMLLCTGVLVGKIKCLKIRLR